MLSIFLMLFGMFGCAASDNDFGPEPPSPSDEMDDNANTHLLVIDLQDGFSSDTVEIEVNGVPTSEASGVTTALLIGLASSIETQVEPGKVSLTVKVPTHNTSDSLDIDLFADTYVGVSLTNGILQFFVSESPFGYG